METAPISAAPPAGAGTTSTAQPYRLRWVVAAVVLASAVMDLLDATIVNVAAPSIHRDLGGGASTIQWLSAGYTLAFAVLLIAGARLGDILGRRRLFLVGSAGFTLFSAACAVAPTIGVLIAFRVLQGAFGALMIPQGFGLMKQVFADDAELGKATWSVRSGNGPGDARRADPRRRAHRRQSLGHRVAPRVPDQRPDRRADIASRDAFAAPRCHAPRRQARHRWRRARRPGAGRDHLSAHPGSDRRLARLVLRDARGRRGPAACLSCATSDAARTH
jgi:hypothetical protein